MSISLSAYMAVKLNLKKNVNISWNIIIIKHETNLHKHNFNETEMDVSIETVQPWEVIIYIGFSIQTDYLLSWM